MLQVKGQCWDCGCKCNSKVDALPIVVEVGTVFGSGTWSVSICIGWLYSKEAFADLMCIAVGTMSCRIDTGSFIHGASSPL